MDRSQCEQFCRWAARNLLAAFPFADNADCDVQVRCENGLADVSLGTDATDGPRAQFFNRSKAATVETLHRLFVDQTKAVKIAGVLVRFCKGSAWVGLCHFCPASIVVEGILGGSRR